MNPLVSPKSRAGERQSRERSWEGFSQQHSWGIWESWNHHQAAVQGEGLPIRPRTWSFLSFLSERHIGQGEWGEKGKSRPQNPFLLPATPLCNLSLLCFRSGPASTLLWWVPGFETGSSHTFIEHLLVERYAWPTFPLCFLVHY